MNDLNEFQKTFMETLAIIQETCVQTALSKNGNQSIEEKYYDITSDIIVRIMEFFDGHDNSKIGRLNIICEKTEESLKDNPLIELHDIVCNYLKGTE